MGRIAHQLIEADLSLLKSGARLHANFATNTPGILYNLVRLNDNLARKAARLADYQKGSVKKFARPFRRSNGLTVLGCNTGIHRLSFERGTSDLLL